MPPFENQTWKNSYDIEISDTGDCTEVENVIIQRPNTFDFFLQKYQSQVDRGLNVEKFQPLIDKMLAWRDAHPQ